MATKLGVFLRKLRIDNNEKMKDMSLILDVSSSFLSAVENGKKPMPSSWPILIKENYNLDKFQVIDLYKSIIESQPYIVIETMDLNEDQINLLAETASTLLDE